MSGDVKFVRQQIDATKLPPNVRGKWSTTALGEGFVPVPKRLIRTLAKLFRDSPEIKELAAVLAVADFKRPNLFRQPSAGYLSFLCGLDQSDFMDALRRLDEKGYVDVRGDEDGLDISLDGLLAAVEREAA